MIVLFNDLEEFLEEFNRVILAEGTPVRVCRRLIAIPHQWPFQTATLVATYVYANGHVARLELYLGIVPKREDRTLSADAEMMWQIVDTLEAGHRSKIVAHCVNVAKGMYIPRGVEE